MISPTNNGRQIGRRNSSAPIRSFSISMNNMEASPVAETTHRLYRCEEILYNRPRLFSLMLHSPIGIPGSLRLLKGIRKITTDSMGIVGLGLPFLYSIEE